MKEKSEGEKELKASKKKGKEKRVFILPEIIEEKDFRGVIAVRFIQSLSNILPKTFRV